MAEERAKRKLTAILSADVEGYSRLMGEDEKATVETLKSYRELMGKLIRQYRGRVVDSPGDNVLAEFASVVDAVECAVKIQEELKTRNEGFPENRRMAFRIGIHHGDVIEDEERIYGDGVNVAARIEGLAEGGGICISMTSFDSVKNKINLGYEYLGEHSVKNINEPVQVYRVLMDPESAGKVIGEKRFLGKISRRAAMAAIIILIIVAAGLLSWIIYSRQSRKVEAASLDQMAFPLPDKPSIAVLPFDNLSGDPEQEYFSDGLTEEIITGLSKIPDLFVIARNSSFIYKNKPVKVQRVSEELGVRFVLEGSVRREGNRVRITAQLIDAIKGYHIWSGRYDRELKDIFALQEDIMRNIILEMQVKLTEGEQARVLAKTFQGKEFNLEAFEKGMQARWYFFKLNPEGNAMARQLAEESVEIEPNTGAYAIVAQTHMQDIAMGLSKSPLQSLALAKEFAHNALQLDDSLPQTRNALASVYYYQQQYDKAIDEAEKAFALDPNGADTNRSLGFHLHMAGRDEEAIPFLKKAIRLNPYPTSNYYWLLGAAYGGLERYDEAIDEYKKALKLDPNNLWVHVWLMATYCLQKRMEDARSEAIEVRRINPQWSINVAVKQWPYKDKKHLKPCVECYRKIGIPED